MKRLLYIYFNSIGPKVYSIFFAIFSVLVVIPIALFGEQASTAALVVVTFHIIVVIANGATYSLGDFEKNALLSGISRKTVVNFRYAVVAINHICYLLFMTAVLLFVMPMVLWYALSIIFFMMIKDCLILPFSYRRRKNATPDLLLLALNILSLNIILIPFAGSINSIDFSDPTFLPSSKLLSLVLFAVVVLASFLSLKISQRKFGKKDL